MMEQKGKYIKTFKLLLPYLWPSNRRDLKIRVSFAVIALVLAKIASLSRTTTVQAPIGN